MILSDLSIRRPVFAWMLMFALIVFGAIALSRLGVSEQPDVDFPVLTVNVRWPGAAPEVMEAEIVDRLEETLVSTQGVRDIISNIQQGQAAITLEFDLERNIDSALTEVQSKISYVALPLGVERPTITKSNPEDQPILLLAVSGKRSLQSLTQFVEVTLADQFKTIPGVGEVVLAGYSQRNLRVWINNNKLKPLQLSVLDVKSAIEQEHIEVAAGYLENARTEMNVRTMGEGLTAEAIGNIQIKSRGGQPIYNSTIRIRDVARVEDGLDDIRRVAVVAESQGLGVGIKKQRGANAVAVSAAVRERLERMRATGIMPADVKVEVNFDSTEFIREAIDETMFTLVLSALVTGVACYLFLGSISSTFNVLLSIPTSVMGTFIVMYYMGFTLNFFTLLGLSLAIGIVVDDAIMVLENIVRHFEMGKNRVRAALDGAREITFAAMAATVAVMAIFLPVAFMHGIIGKFFFQFGITISTAVALSLLEAITITPMRCSQMMSRSHRVPLIMRVSGPFFEWLSVAYRWSLGVSLHLRAVVLMAATGLFVYSLNLSNDLPREFVPSQDQGVFIVRVQTPVGSSLAFTAQKLLQADRILKSKPEISRYFSAIGGFTQTGGTPAGAVTDDAVNAATLYVTLTPRREHSFAMDTHFPFVHINWNAKVLRQKSQARIMEELRAELNAIPDFRAVPQDLSTRGFTAQRGFPIEVNLRGADYKELQKISLKLVERMNKSGLVTDVDTDFRTGMPEVRVWPNRQAAAQRGISVQAIADTVSTAIGGAAQGKFTSGDRRYDVRLRLEGAERVGEADIRKLEVRTSYGELLPITEVARTETVTTYQTLTRRLRERSISIFANVAPGKSQAEALEAVETMSKDLLPNGYRLFLGGGAAIFRETFSSLTFALWLGVLVAYMVLASQFNSYLHPLSVLLALPFSVSGAFLGLILAGQSLNLYSLIGFVLLMGIVKKNSILLVEFANQCRYEQGMPLREAILQAGYVRLRPILMTSFATLAAAVPPALAIGPGAESRIPLAVTILGGVTVSTILTLFVVPCAYSLLAAFERPMTEEERLEREGHAHEHGPGPGAEPSEPWLADLEREADDDDAEPAVLANTHEPLPPMAPERATEPEVHANPPRQVEAAVDSPESASRLPATTSAPPAAPAALSAPASSPAPPEMPAPRPGPQYTSTTRPASAPIEPGKGAQPSTPDAAASPARPRPPTPGTRAAWVEAAMERERRIERERRQKDGSDNASGNA
ncbi:AcrB/AcrD/AcrF family protein [Verrucomicrobia bacterium LW23]|nr:AcrB/AcrD/AcrF family protein [Verrucomicrobia bacterium LW23]